MNNSYHIFPRKSHAFPSKSSNISKRKIPSSPVETSHLSSTPIWGTAKETKCWRTLPPSPISTRKTRRDATKTDPWLIPWGAEHRWDFIDFSGIKPLGFDDFSWFFLGWLMTWRGDFTPLFCHMEPKNRVWKLTRDPRDFSCTGWSHKVRIPITLWCRDHNPCWLMITGDYTKPTFGGRSQSIKGIPVNQPSFSEFLFSDFADRSAPRLTIPEKLTVGPEGTPHCFSCLSPTLGRVVLWKLEGLKLTFFFHGLASGNQTMAWVCH